MAHKKNEDKVLTCLIGLALISMLIIDYRIMACSLVFAFIVLLGSHFNTGKVVESIHEFIHDAHMLIKDKCTSKLNEFLMALAFLWVIICFIVYIYIVVSFII